MHTELMTLFLLTALLTAAAVGVAFGAEPPNRAGRILLNQCTIVVDDDLPPYLLSQIDDLKSYLEEITGSKVVIAKKIPATGGTVIAVGGQAARFTATESADSGALGEEGFTLTSGEREGRTYVLATGGKSPCGSANAVTQLMRIVRSDGRTAFVEGPVNIRSVPSFKVRGMHLNGWSFNSPYAFRRWSEQEWKDYIDLLSYEHVNLFYIWPFMEIIPLPISKEDEAYLREVRRVIDYAQKRHGMEVWIMQAVNRVAKDNCGVADPRNRPYWRPVQEDLNPGDPEQFARITASHDQLYRIVNNADGVCFIDSDPGGWPNSPVSDLMKVFHNARTCLDRYNVHGKDAKIIHWLWGSWGQTQADDNTRAQTMKDTLRAMKGQLAEPWQIIAGQPAFLPICRDEGVLNKTIYLPYSTIEDEPSYPGTNMGLDAVGHTFDGLQEYPELLGVMGNAQCPLIQFPRIHDYLSSAWDINSRARPETEIVRDLSELLYPDQRELISNCFLALSERDVKKLQSLCAQLSSIVDCGKLGRAGLFARKTFPTSQFVAKTLLLQLRMKLALERLYQELKPSSTRLECEELVTHCLDAYLAWDEDHGWHELWGGGTWRLGRFGDDPQFTKAVHAIRRVVGDDASVTSFFGDVSKRLSRKFDPAHVRDNAVGLVKERVLASVIVNIEPNLAGDAKVTASVVPNRELYPPEAANDGDSATLYWPGILTSDNSEWLQLAWDRPRSIKSVTVYFLRHESMWKRVIHLQKEASPGVWVDIAEATPADLNGFAVAKFDLKSATSADRVRVVNLLDVFEVVVQ